MRALFSQRVGLFLQPAKNLTSGDGRTGIDARLNIALEFSTSSLDAYSLVKQFGSILVRTRLQLVLNELLVIWRDVAGHQDSPFSSTGSDPQDSPFLRHSPNQLVFPCPIEVGEAVPCIA